MILQLDKPSERRSLRVLENDPDAVARQILDFIAELGAWNLVAR